MGEIDFPQCTSERSPDGAKRHPGSHYFPDYCRHPGFRYAQSGLLAWPRRRFDGNPIFRGLLEVADRRRPLDRGAGPH
jgi:hypothetical protein